MESYYSVDKWKDCGTYYIYNDNPASIGSKQSKKCRITPSRVDKCIGPSKFSKPDDIVLEIAGIKKQEIIPEAQAKIDYGILHEKDARQWYMIKTGYQIKQPGFAVPKFDLRLGGESDGLVYDKNDNELDGIIEIKCPTVMYEPIKEHLKKNNNLTKIEDYTYNNNYKHIWKSHYTQMQMEMAIYDKNWCDYIVYCIPENFVFLERVYRNKQYWDELYEKVKTFIDYKLTPILEEINSKYPFLPGNNDNL